MTRIAFLGLGDIGSRMAQRIATAGFDLAVWNRTPARAQEFAAALTGGLRTHISTSAAEAASGADVIITCLSTSGDVVSLLADNPTLLNGILARGRVGGLYVG